MPRARATAAKKAPAKRAPKKVAKSAKKAAPKKAATKKTARKPAKKAAKKTAAKKGRKWASLTLFTIGLKTEEWASRSFSIFFQLKIQITHTLFPIPISISMTQFSHSSSYISL